MPLMDNNFFNVFIWFSDACFKNLLLSPKVKSGLRKQWLDIKFLLLALLPKGFECSVFSTKNRLFSLIS